MVGLAIVVGVLGLVALRQPDLPDFEPSGPPAVVPSEAVAPVSLAEFEQIMVGLKGTPVLLNIWGSWCAPCRTEMPLLQQAAITYEGRAIVLGVAARDNPAQARKFLADTSITYPNVLDDTGAITRALDVNAFPTTYLFDADGTLVARVNGGISEQRVAGLIEDVLP